MRGVAGQCGWAGRGLLASRTGLSCWAGAVVEAVVSPGWGPRGQLAWLTPLASLPFVSLAGLFSPRPQGAQALFSLTVSLPDHLLVPLSRTRV